LTADGRPLTTDEGARGRTLIPGTWNLAPHTAVGGRWSAVVLIAFALRLRGLFANTFHADEALFASWARLIAVWRDPLLLTQPVDKPPLLFYSQALFYPLFGPVEWAARLPSLLASLLLIPLTAQLAWRLGGDRLAAFIAAAVVAVAPLAVQFSATAFSDPLLTLWLTAALALVVPSPLGRGLGRGAARPGWAGLCLGLALATKYQAALFLPLVVGLAWLSGWRAREWARGLAGLAVVLAVVALWAAARADGAGLVARQWANVGGLRLAWSWELGPRLAEQGRLWWLGLGGPLLALGGVALAGVAVSRRARARLGAADGLLALFVLAYALLHWLWAVPAWDRYLLPVLPIVAALLGRGVAAVWRAADGGHVAGQWVGAALLVAVVALHLPVAANARTGRYPLGGQPAADGGAARVARALADAPYGTVLYDHWYSWHWRYQLFDGRVYVSWFPHTDALLADLAAFGGSGPARYVALPRDGSAAPVQRRLGEAGYRLVAVPGPAEAAMGLWRIESEATDE
jgi:4-amino-4-deoxy-L-arabinose transferase-like glycosyltransferase